MAANETTAECLVCKRGHDLRLHGNLLANGNGHLFLQCRICNAAKAKARKAARAIAEGRPVGQIGRPRKHLLGTDQ